MNYLLDLVKLADELDKKGLLLEADHIDNIIKLAVAWPKLPEWLHKQYTKLRTLFSKKKKDPKATQEYDTAAGNRLDDMLRRKQSGPQEERIFLWFCNQFPNTCPSCRERHGRMRTLRQWRTEGLPGPFVCENAQCGCRLVQLGPSGTIQTDDDGNIAAGIIGLREDNSGANMQQGFTLEPFYSNSSNLE